MTKNDMYFMELAYEQALKSFRINEVPIGAVLVDNAGEIIARSYNQIEKKNSQLAHAEILVLAKAAKKMNNWRLSRATLYVTLQPCLMCLGALYLSRVSRVVYGATSLKFGVSLDQVVLTGIYRNLDTKVECLNYKKSQDILKLFFQRRRSSVHDE